MSKGKEKTTSEKLMEIVNELHLFGDSSVRGWARVNCHCYPVQSSKFESWLQWKYYDFHKEVPSDNAIKSIK